MKGIRWNKHTHNDKPKIDPKTTSRVRKNWKRIGNDHLVYKNYKDAIIAYTMGMADGDNSIEMLANRSLAYLRICNYKCAFIDLELALVIDKDNTKYICRKAEVLFGMSLYRNAMELLENISLESLPEKEKETVKKLMVSGKRYIAQSENGVYPWDEIYRTTSIYHDMAEYKNAVILKESPGKGRGIFASKMIKSGELVLASKAFAYVQDGTPNYQTFTLKFISRCVPKIHVKLIKKATEKLHTLSEYPEQSHVFGTLYAGPELGYWNIEEAESNNFQMDQKRIEHISVYNTISTNDGIDGSFIRGAGLWIVPSYINHDCVDANCSWLVVGDFLFVRAFKDISEGDEILITYKPAPGLIAHERLDTYDFICQCRLCARDRLDIGHLKTNRISLYSKLKTCLERINDSTSHMAEKNDNEIENLIKLLEQSRKDAPELNLCLVNELLTIGKIYFENGKFRKSGSMFVKVYYLTEDVPAFAEATIKACIYIILCLLEINQSPKAIHWTEILKTKTKLYFVTLTVLDINFSKAVEKFRLYALDI